MTPPAQAPRLSARHVGELVAELGPLVAGSEVLEVQARPPRDCTLVLRTAPGPGGVRRLRLSADPEAARLHLEGRPARRHEGSADPFFARLAEALEGATLQLLEQVRGDRVARLGLRRDGRPTAALVLELTGRHANLVLLDGAGRVLACLVPPRSEGPAAARLLPGGVYGLPPGRAPADPGPPLAEVLPEPPVRPGESEAPLSARVEHALAGISEERHLEDLRRVLQRRLERRVESARALLAGLERRAESSGAAERVRMDGELLLAHLARIERGARSVELPDDHGPEGSTRTIELDPGLSARRNAEKLFARYKKLRRTAERLPEEQALAREGLARAEEWLARAASEDPRTLASAAEAAGVLPPSQPAPRERVKVEPRLPYLRFRALRGSEVRVGRNASDNDRLTFRESNGNDLWLHTADAPGSHVVLRLARGAEPDPEEVLDAAHLAVHFSPLRGAPRVDVHVARRKLVHKPRKAPPGLVTLSGGRVLRVRMEAGRLERLLDTRGRSGRSPEAAPG